MKGIYKIILAGGLLVPLSSFADGSILDGVRMGEVNFNLEFNTAVNLALELANESEGNVENSRRSLHPDMAPNFASITRVDGGRLEDNWEIMTDGDSITYLYRSELYPEYQDYTNYPSIEATRRLLISNMGEPTLTEEVPETEGRPRGYMMWFEDSTGTLLHEGDQVGLCPLYQELFKQVPNLIQLEGHDLSNCGAVVIFEYLLVGGDSRFFYNYHYSAFDVESQLEYIIPALDSRQELMDQESAEGSTPVF